MGEKNLHITVAAAPSPDFGNPRILDHDLRLIKASVLYADRVKLCSMAAWMVTSFYLIGNLPFNDAQQVETIISISAAIAPNNPDIAKTLPQLQNIGKLFSRNPITLTRKEREKKSEFKKVLRGIWSNLQNTFNNGVGNVGFSEIELAAKEGILEIHPFSNTVGTDELTHEYLAVVQDMLSSSLTHPMLDEQTSNIVRLALEEGKMTTGNRSVKNSKQIGLVADLFDRLPVFDIKMDELLDLRSELQKPLIHFRAKMLNLSKNIETASWDKDFEYDVQDTVQTEIEPALSEIEDKLKSNEFKEFWSRKIVERSGSLATGYGSSFAFGAAISPLAGIAFAFLTTNLFIKAG